MAGPLEQFKITPYAEMEVAGVDASFTNSSLWMVIVVTSLAFFLVGGIRKSALVPGRWQSMVEMAYEFVANMVKENVGREGKQYFPFIFTLFMFVLGGNLAGMLPYSFTITSHIIVTLALALVVFIGVTLLGFMKHGFGFLKLFVLKVFAGFVVSLGAAGILGAGAAVLPFAFNIFLVGLELLVAFLQAYVFAILSCIYLHDALHPAH